ncbi:hypothetical protein T11_12088 [Trichinella zimbabwensis]|uniref:Uncharacterized protein n=1 Tax=Trichinella zimbabwensis TaxID=268475 RepID=A0A0V1G7E0_9BILA|nr:hypothetical protein T11_12088 [Trichinella zimbabwensis]
MSKVKIHHAEFSEISLDQQICDAEYRYNVMSVDIAPNTS